MAGRQRNDRRANPQVLSSPVAQHHMGAPACVKIASTPPERFENCRLQPILRVRRRVAAPRRTVRLVDRNGATRLRQPPKLVHELSIPADWREEETDVGEVKRAGRKRGSVCVNLENLDVRKGVSLERSDFVLWPQAAVEGCLLFRRCQGISRHSANRPKMTRLTQTRPTKGH